MEKVTKQLEKYVKKQCQLTKKDGVFTQNLVEEVCGHFLSGEFDFANAIEFRHAKKWNKKRLVATMANPFSTEFFLSKYIAQIIKQQTKLQWNSTDDVVDGILESMNKMDANNFCMVKFDFVNFYNSISSQFVYKKFLQEVDFHVTDRHLIENYIQKVPYLFAGLPASNILAELVMQQFCQHLKHALKHFALIDILHYSDDVIVLLNQNMHKQEVWQVIKNAIQQFFFDPSIDVKIKNKTKVHYDDEKFGFYSSLPFTLDYLGYCLNFFEKNQKMDFTIGLSPFFEHLFEQKIKKLIKEHFDNQEALRTLLKLSTRRFVFRKQMIYKNNLTVSSSYTQKKLFKKYMLKLDEQTVQFLHNALTNAFNELSLPLPHYLKDQNPLSGYSLWGSLQKNRALVVVPKLGLNKKQLSSLLAVVSSKKVTNYAQMQKNAKQLFLNK